MAALDDGARDRGWRVLMGLSYGALAIVGAAFVLIFAAVVIGLVVWHAGSPGPDTAKARAEVQRYFDAKAPRQADVRSCVYAPVGDSDFETFSCNVEVACHRRVVFSVPRAAASFRSDLPAQPRADVLPLRCDAQPGRR